MISEQSKEIVNYLRNFLPSSLLYKNFISKNNTLDIIYIGLDGSRCLNLDTVISDIDLLVIYVPKDKNAQLESLLEDFNITIKGIHIHWFYKSIYNYLGINFNKFKLISIYGQSLILKLNYSECVIWAKDYMSNLVSYLKTQEKEIIKICTFGYYDYLLSRNDLNTFLIDTENYFKQNVETDVTKLFYYFCILSYFYFDESLDRELLLKIKHLPLMNIDDRLYNFILSRTNKLKSEITANINNYNYKAEKARINQLIANKYEELKTNVL